MYFIDFTERGDPEDYVSLAPGTTRYKTDEGKVVEEVQVSAARAQKPEPWAYWVLGLLVLGGLIALSR